MKTIKMKNKTIKKILSELKSISKELDLKILETPSGNRRNNLCNSDVFLMKAIEELEDAEKIELYEKIRYNY